MPLSNPHLKLIFKKNNLNILFSKSQLLFFYLDNITELYYQVNIFGLSVTMITIMISLSLFG